MRLLMLSRKIDEDDASPAGFAYGWVKKIDEKLDKLYVLVWQKSSRGDLTQNIEIISLPKNKLLKILALQIKLLKILPKVDGVFCHQNPEYTILAAPLAKLFRKKIVSWYTHKAVNWKLYLVNLLTDKILTASPESCRLKDRRKIGVVGHGIDIDKFQMSNFKCQINSKFILLSVGRISLIKDYETLINAIEILDRRGIANLEVKIIGQPVLERDKNYFETLKQMISQKKLGHKIKFLGGVAHSQILSYYQGADLFVNLSQTGSVDKAVLEAMACQCLVLTSNEAFKNILKDKRLMFEPKNPENLAQKIINLMNLSSEKKEIIGKKLRQEVVAEHNLNNLAEKIIKEFL